MGMAGVDKTIGVVACDGDNSTRGVIQLVYRHISHRAFFTEIGRNSNILGPIAQAGSE